MKGFKKDGKFRPTGNKNKSALTKSDIRKRDTRNLGELAGFQDIIINKSLDAGDKTIGNPMFAESVKEAGKEKSRSGFNFLKKQVASNIEKSKKANAEKKKRVEQEAEAERRVILINQDTIDMILDNRQTTNEQKFRFLQRFAVENNNTLTDNQRFFINNALKALESEGTTPQTFLGVSSSRDSSSRDSSSRAYSPRVGSSPVPIRPVQMASGIMATPTRDEHILNQIASENTNRFTPTPMIEQPVTTTTTTTSSAFPSKLSDNLNAEISAVVGR